MATTTLVPTSAHGNGVNVATIDRALIVDGSDATYVESVATPGAVGQWRFQLSDTPADFGQNPSATVNIRVGLSATGDDVWEIKAYLIDVNGQAATIPGYQPVTSTTPTNLTFPGVAPLLTGKSAWDGAVLLIQFNNIKTKGADANTLRVFEASATVTYDPVVQGTTYTRTAADSAPASDAATGSVVVLENPPSAAPTVTATAASSSQINLSWTPVPLATSYEVSLADGTILVASTTDTTFSHTGLLPSTAYSYRVRGKNNVGPGPYGTASATTQAAVQPAQKARPSANGSSVGAWTVVPTGASAYTTINEVTPDDASYVMSPSNPDVTVYYGFRLGTLEDPLTNEGHVLRYRISKEAAAGRTIQFVIRLYNGDPSAGGTEVASWTHTDVSDIWTEHTQNLTTAQAALVTDYRNLYVRFDPTSSGGGAGRSARLSWLQLEVPHAYTKVRGTSDSAPSSDALTHLRIPLLKERTTADTIATSDVAAKVTLAKRTVTDSFTLSEQATRYSSRVRTAPDSAPASDQGVRKITAPRTSQDARALSDQATSVRTQVRSASDAASASDAVIRQPINGRTGSDTAPAIDSVTRTGTFTTYLDVADSATVIDLATRTTVYARFNPRRAV